MRTYKYENLKEEFNTARREFRRIVRVSKLQSWQKFTSEIQDPWEKLIKIVKATATGKIQTRTLADLQGNFAADMKQTLLLLGKQFFPSPMMNSVLHKAIEGKVESMLQEVSPGPDITICEFRKALSEMSRSTAPGTDLITNNVIYILATKGKLERKYLRVFNVCLRNLHFPRIWKKAKIVLVPKTSGNLNTTKAYRPIALTSSYSKLLERIILARLLHYLHIAGKMTSNQHAYKKGSSTQTALYELFNVVQSATNKRGGGFCVVVFLDITGAFDTTWHYGILHKLLLYGVPRYLVAWMKDFLNGRVAYLSEGDEEHEVDLHQGCPQGGVLSPVLWNVLFNEMLGIETEKGRSKIDYLKVVGYADDAAIVCRAATKEEAARLVNNHLEKIRVWSVDNKVKFNPTKLAAMTISNRTVRPKPIAVFYDGILVNEVQNYKYLGLTVDNRLLWTTHINNVLNKLALITKSLRGLSWGSWGVSLEVYRLLFHAIFIPTMLYGVSIWGWKAMPKLVCMKFDKEIRRFSLMATRCRRSTSNIFIFQLLKTNSFSHVLFFEVLKVSVQQFQITHTERQSVYETYQRNRIKREVPQCMDHHHFMCRRGIQHEICDAEFEDVNEQYRVHPARWANTVTIVDDKVAAIAKGVDKRDWVIFSDASASSYGTGWGYVAFKNGLCKTTCNGALTRCTIFTVEAFALYKAVQYVNNIDGLGRKEVIEIRSDAQGLVRSLGRMVQTNKLLGKIKEELYKAFHSGKNVVIRWIPGHNDIRGNEYADSLAKKGNDSRAVTPIAIMRKDVAQIIRERGQLSVGHGMSLSLEILNFSCLT